MTQPGEAVDEPQGAADGDDRPKAQCTPVASVIVDDRETRSGVFEALMGAVISLTLIYGLPVLRSRDPGETARLLVYAAEQLRRHADGALARRGKRPRGKRRIQLRLLQGLPGIGPARAAGLLERFGCVEAVMTASAESLLTVDGIGPKTAAAIRKALS